MRTAGKRKTDDPYAPASASAGLLRAGTKARTARLAAADMLTLRQAATVLRIDADEILQWHRLGRCIGVFTAGGKLRLPKWQFEPEIWLLIEAICECLGTAEGWKILSFLESPADGLDGVTPRTALERGVPAERVLAAAVSSAH